MGANREGRRAIPGHHYSGLEIVEAGPPDYLMPMGDKPGYGTPSPPPLSAYYQSRTPLVPTADELAKLPRLARVVFSGVRGHEDGLHEQEAGADHQAAVGEVEHRPLDVVEVQEVAHPVEHQPVVQVAHRPGQDQAQSGH